MIASVLSKKVAAGATHVVFDKTGTLTEGGGAGSFPTEPGGFIGTPGVRSGGSGFPPPGTAAGVLAEAGGRGAI